MNKSNLEKEGLISPYVEQKPQQELKAGLGGRNWNRYQKRVMSPGLFFMACSGTSCTQHKTTFSGVVPTSLVGTTSIINQENEPKDLPIWRRNFLNWGSVLPDDHYLCQVDKNQANNKKTNPSSYFLWKVKQNWLSTLMDLSYERKWVHELECAWY